MCELQLTVGIMSCTALLTTLCVKGGTHPEHLLDDGLYVAILVPRMTLLEGPPVIAEDLLEGVFVDPLYNGCHSAGLYHVLALRSSRFS